MRYDLHQNDPTDTGYRRFLNNLMEPVAGSLSPGAEGLDYGCGPGPTLSLMFREAGFYCADYDPFYAPDPVVLERQYDFLTCSEVIEHCHYPMKEFDRFLRLVRPGGVIGVMTQLVRDQAAFAKWHYIDDETHVCFFSEETFQWLGNYLDIEVVSHKKSVTLFCV